jgi:hypothetical protein
VNATVDRASNPHSGRFAVLVVDAAVVLGGVVLVVDAVGMPPWWNLHINVKASAILAPPKERHEDR